MIKLSYKTNFSFSKLKRYIQTRKFGKVVDEVIAKPLVEDSKERIRTNKVKPATSPQTIKKRRARKSPKTISDSTLYDTGKLHDSIKLTNQASSDSSIKMSDGVEFIEYGKHHQFNPNESKKREFISFTVKNAEKASENIKQEFERAWRQKYHSKQS